MFSSGGPAPTLFFARAFLSFSFNPPHYIFYIESARTGLSRNRKAAIMMTIQINPPYTIADYRKEKQVDKDRNITAAAEEYMSVADASKEFGLNKSMIRAAIQKGTVQTVSHPWGMRVLRSDVARLKEERARMEQARQG